MEKYKSDATKESDIKIEVKTYWENDNKDRIERVTVTHFPTNIRKTVLSYIGQLVAYNEAIKRIETALSNTNTGGLVYPEGLAILHNDSIITNEQADKIKKTFSEIDFSKELPKITPLKEQDIKLMKENLTINLKEKLLSFTKNREIIIDENNKEGDFEEFLHEEIAFMPNPHMDDRVYLCEEGLMNCFVCAGKENCNKYRAKDIGLEE